MSVLWSVTRNTSEELSTADERIAWFASRQHGVITAPQLHRCGIDDDAILYRSRLCRLHRLYRAIYSVGHQTLSNEGRWMASVLACGDAAALSHRSAAQLWRLLPAAIHPIHVTVPFERQPRHAAIVIHRSRTLTPAEVTQRDRIPVTRPSRTLRDLRRAEPAGLVRKATRQAEFLGLPLDHISTDRTRSELERMFLALCRRPPSHLCTRFSLRGDLREDGRCRWPGERLVTSNGRPHQGGHFEFERGGPPATAGPA